MYGQLTTSTPNSTQSVVCKGGNEMVSFGDTVSTYFNHHGGRGGGVLGKLRFELGKES